MTFLGLKEVTPQDVRRAHAKYLILLVEMLAPKSCICEAQRVW